MMKWIIRILFLLILGVVTTVGVAWGLAATSAPRFENWTITGDPSVQQTWTLHVPDDVEQRRFRRGDARSGNDVGVDEIIQYDIGGMHGPFRSLHVLRAGLPARALRCHYWTRHLDSLDVLGHYEPRSVLFWPSDADHSDKQRVRVLPLRPVFPGFLVDTLFYAAMWFGIFFGVAALRRFVRKKRGRCVTCGYDLRGEFDKGCAECGWGREP